MLQWNGMMLTLNWTILVLEWDAIQLWYWKGTATQQWSAGIEQLYNNGIGI